ncbi:hypothetical protein [Secundilactobacillus folii]|uniref:Uncharacterized protein n=1 Tax=Secundilactobacillus folii TaxID=2678357 RepID=A0A7X2XTC1_9LACO|nr:hypothetical protein [Secundilactobacillus folii]MTV81170.1 hypothetical protein [Secundilactobacillus folii]
MIDFKIRTLDKFPKGGINLFGHQFGDYPQDINVRFAYKNQDSALLEGSKN